jgi:hypothetical protein
LEVRKAGVYKKKALIIETQSNKAGYVADKKGMDLNVGEKHKEEKKKEGCKC